MISRRGLVTGLAALVAAPAVVRAASLMQVRGIPLLEGPLPGWIYLRGQVLRRDWYPELSELISPQVDWIRQQLFDETEWTCRLPNFCGTFGDTVEVAVATRNMDKIQAGTMLRFETNSEVTNV